MVRGLSSSIIPRMCCCYIQDLKEKNENSQAFTDFSRENVVWLTCGPYSIVWATRFPAFDDNTSDKDDL